jgi:hypothetical protein
VTPTPPAKAHARQPGFDFLFIDTNAVGGRWIERADDCFANQSHTPESGEDIDYDRYDPTIAEDSVFDWCQNRRVDSRDVADPDVGDVYDCGMDSNSSDAMSESSSDEDINDPRWGNMSASDFGLGRKAMKHFACTYDSARFLIPIMKVKIGINRARVEHLVKDVRGTRTHTDAPFEHLKHGSFSRCVYQSLIFDHIRLSAYVHMWILLFRVVDNQCRLRF